ncbi:putative signal peptidase complex subunit spc25 [Paramicrosporidium saccamoebae]|uniref:Signal peptidase complex subunit 2 n=1 Tax=Paramicrosporidium saccamoebae TaxID=1246581 RepID=A0A2H9THC7_9FUNG|nr:putative signal peptidase complex subunit spc25 [Paramicrosporidium saccamoebae]
MIILSADASCFGKKRSKKPTKGAAVKGSTDAAEPTIVVEPTTDLLEVKGTATEPAKTPEDEAKLIIARTFKEIVHYYPPYGKSIHSCQSSWYVVALATKFVERTPVKVNKWNSQEVRVALDDLVAKAQYKENTSLVNYKLLFVLTLTIVGGATSYYAFITPFAKGRILVGAGVALYMVVLGLYTLSLGFLMTSTCFRGTQPSTKKMVWIQSKLELPAAIYHLTLLNPKTGKPLKCTKSWSIGAWICEDGKVSPTAFCADMEAFIKSDNFKSALRSE